MTIAADNPQLLLSFEPTATPERQFVLRVCGSEQDYFDRSADPAAAAAYPMDIPRPFRDTAFMDDGGWRRKIRPQGPAQSLGYRAWSQLPGPVIADLTSGTPEHPRRVAIVSQSTGVDAVPWEWLNDGRIPAAASPSVRFIRIVPCRYSAPPLTVPPPVRILTVTTNPKDERLLNPSAERNIIIGTVRAKTDDYELRDLMEPGIDGFAEALKWSPHIVHYVGHSGITSQNGAIILHDDSGGTRWVSAPEISRMLPSSVKLLCLSTCVTADNYDVAGLARIAHLPNDLSLPTTIVNQYAITAETAATFWKVFYGALITRAGDVVEAFHEARMSAFAQSFDTSSWASFSLIVRDSTGHPLRLGRSFGHAPELFAAEIQAQWSARMANSVASRLKMLHGGSHKEMSDLLGSEEARIDYYQKEIEKF